MNKSEREDSPAPQGVASSDEDTEDASEVETESKMESEVFGGMGNTFDDRLRGLQGQLERLENGQDPEYLYRKKELESTRENRIFMAETWMLYEIECIERDYEREIELAQEEFEAKKLELKECLLGEIQEKQRTMEQERTSLDLAIEPTEIKPMTTRKLRRRFHEPLPTQDKRRKTSALSNLMYLLKDEDINEDLRAIFKNRAHIIPKTYNQASSSSEGVVHEVKVEEGRLWYNKKWFHKGQHILLESVEHGQESGIITSISNNEIWVGCLPEHSKLRVNLSHLIKGKYILKRRSA